jgi:S1-C subfamily serine protease
MRFILLLILSFFLIFPSYAYDEKIKLNRTDIDTDSKKETIKINLNNMLDLREIKKTNKKYTSIERYVKEASRKISKNGNRIKYKGLAVNIFKNNASAVVYIGNEKENGMGTGSIINKNGEIITNWHVVGNAKKLRIWLLPDDPEKMDENLLWREPNFVGTVINRNKGKDLALVKVEGLPKNIKIIRFGKTSDVPIGSTVYAIGHPSGEAWTFSSGMVTQIRPNYTWDYDSSTHKANVIQHEVPTNPGNSGGPLLNEKGMMVGVNSFVRTNTQLINFSVAIEEVKAFLKEEIKEDKPEYIKKKKKPTYITKKCKEKNKYLQKKCKKEQSFKSGDGIKKTYPNAITGDANNNGIDDTWYVDENKNGKIDTAFVDDNEDGIIEAVMLDENENRVWEILTIDEDLNGYPDILLMDRDEDGKVDVIAYDYNEDGEWDKFEKLS